MKTRSAPPQWHVTETTCPPAFCSRPHRGHRHSRRTSRSTRLPGPFMVLTVDSRSSLAAPGNPPGFPSASGGLVTVAPRATCFHQPPPFRSPRFRQPNTAHQPSPARLVPHQDTMVHPRQLPVDFPFVAELAGAGPGGGGVVFDPSGCGRYTRRTGPGSQGQIWRIGPGPLPFAPAG